MKTVANKIIKLKNLDSLAERLDYETRANAIYTDGGTQRLGVISGPLPVVVEQIRHYFPQSDERTIVNYKSEKGILGRYHHSIKIDSYSSESMGKTHTKADISFSSKTPIAI